MILVAIKDTSVIRKGDKYFCFGIDVYLDRNKVYVFIRANDDGTPVLCELSDFSILSEGGVKYWKEKRFLNGLRIRILPKEFYEFDWDLYHDGDEYMQDEFERVYSIFKNRQII